MSDFKIKCYSEYVLRTPLFSLSSYLQLIQDYSSEKAIELYNDAVIKEAIGLASPELRQGLDKWAADDSELSEDKKKAFELTFLKYLSRMSSRCTPFGLFAGCSVGNFSSETNIVLDSLDHHKRFSQFDMHYWVAMLQDLAKRKDVAAHLNFYPNTSIYEIGEFYRFVEYKYAGTKREHTISAIRKTDLLKQIQFQAKSGITIDEMIFFLADDESEKEDAFEFISQLIAFQFLISELDATVTGDNEWKKLFSVLNRIPGFNNQIALFKNLEKNLSDLDRNLIPSKETYDSIKTTINKIGTPFEEKFLFQTDLNVTTLTNTLNKNIPEKIFRAIQFLNGIQNRVPIQNLENFKKSFTQRYESKEMPLPLVLDTETGIGYLQNQDMNDHHEILESYLFKAKITEQKNQNWNSLDFILHNKLQQCLKNNDTFISLSENDFPDFDSNFKNTPATFSVMIEYYNDKNIALTSTGNTSASKLLSRFCNGNEQIYNLTKEIVQKENEYHSGKILSEIVHIPESRIGNIIRRPILRKHEISYLCAPGVPIEDNLDLNDLWISIQSGRIILRSKKHNAEILPCLSNAHNFLTDSLPIYHFLCDLERQNTKPVYSFSWGALVPHYDFFPRVIYNEIILSKAKWIIKKEEITVFQKMDKTILMHHFSEWRAKRNIPRFTNLSNSNNTLFFDFETQICIVLFLKSVKGMEEFSLDEFLFTDKSIVQNSTGESFCNQIILSYYKKRS
ncbi:lantibiotic dehydratase family protein [Flavobacterium sp. HTF]|uniref:lantibiotic dehydratase family protein n=1 Tax=Flavobacterium sp. HTF TaxID=2170732 RepID=UPI000D5D3FF6|nr:lantibiotic dehydratase family protein [Flavobacterium sp. HTF]PWB19448.1 hypothetical protein DCO46_21455 [Flavobacterium sp. HTF]